jgi:hypothetical protein
MLHLLQIKDKDSVKDTGPNLSGRPDDVNPFSKTGQEQSKEDKYDKFSKLKV